MYHPLELMAPTHWGGGGGVYLEAQHRNSNKNSNNLGFDNYTFWHTGSLLLETYDDAVAVC